MQRLTRASPFGDGRSGPTCGRHGNAVRPRYHAYPARLRAVYQGRGIGAALLKSFIDRTDGMLLVGTWAAAECAIHFYERHGFRLVSTEEKKQTSSHVLNNSAAAKRNFSGAGKRGLTSSKGRLFPVPIA